MVEDTVNCFDHNVNGDELVAHVVDSCRQVPGLVNFVESLHSYLHLT